MSRKRHTAEQVEVAVANGKTTAQAAKEAEITEQTYYRWRKEYGGLQVDQAKRLKELEQEIAQTRGRDSWQVGKDLVYRLSKEEELGLRKRPAGRLRTMVHRQERFKPTFPIRFGPWTINSGMDSLCRPTRISQSMYKR